MALQQQFAGALSDLKDASADPNVQKIVHEVQSELETKSELKFTSLEVVSFKTQVVNGTNYFVKTKGLTEAGESNIIHLMIYQHFRGTVHLKSFELNKKLEDEIERGHTIRSGCYFLPPGVGEDSPGGKHLESEASEPEPGRESSEAGREEQQVAASLTKDQIEPTSKTIQLIPVPGTGSSIQAGQQEQQAAAGGDVSVKGFMDKVKVMVGSAGDHHHPQQPGGLGQVLASEPEVQQMVDQVRRELETKAELKFTSLEVVSYRSQIVAGTNYYVKTKGVSEAGDEHFIHLTIYKHFSGSVQLTSFELNKRLEDEIEPSTRTSQPASDAHLGKTSGSFHMKFGGGQGEQQAAEGQSEESAEAAGEQKPAGPGAKFRGLLGQIHLLKNPGQAASGAQEADEQQPGGLGQEETPESGSKVHEVVEKVKPALEQRSGLKFASLEVISFKTQVVAGTNYFVKAKAVTDAGEEQFVHLRIYNRFTGTVELTSYQLDRKLDDKIEYFD